ncbi:hypothetical protein DM02DRAFT_618126 [Periconia macrospinosa]|uniref:Uncharacterized protein n=1 Tax=Periconia macrospinosa TaxID=97972 RepID=A0A2V1DAF9_9PLEO|nr:hypothetical protein DM02DRAFT_618126 [Periconia macrospinosa]
MLSVCCLRRRSSNVLCLDFIGARALLRALLTWTGVTASVAAYAYAYACPLLSSPYKPSAAASCLLSSSYPTSHSQPQPTYSR